MKSETLYRIWGYAALFVVTFVLASLCMQAAHCQTVLMPMPRQCFPDNLASGKPLAGGKIFTYQAGTSIQQATFTDATGLIQNTNPVILDAAGCASIWLTSGQAYRFVAQNSVGVQEWVTDQVSGLATNAFAFNQAITNVSFVSTPTFTTTGQIQTFKMVLTGNVTSSTLSMTGITVPSLVIFELTQDVTGGRTFVWPLNTAGGSVINPTPNAVSVQEFMWDGTTAWALGPAMPGTVINFFNSSDTVVGRSTTDTLSNKTLTSAVLNNPNFNSVCSVTAGPATYVCIANASSTGTTVSTLTTYTNAPVNAVIATTSTTSGVVGICVSNCSTSGTATIQQSGVANCVFDGATTAGDYVQVSSTTGGNCHDAGAAFPQFNGQVVGRVNTTNGGVGTYAVTLFGPEIQAPAATKVLTADGTTTTQTFSGTSFQALKNFSIPANQLNAIGKTIRVTGVGTITPAVTNAPTAYWSFGTTSALGGTNLQNGSEGSSSSAFPFGATPLTCTVITTGSSGTMSCAWVAYQNTALTAAAQGQTVTVNLTVPLFVGMGCQFSVSNASNSCNETLLVVEQLN